MYLVRWGYILKTLLSGGGGGSVTTDIATTQLINIRNIGTFAQQTTNTNYRLVTERLRLFHDARTKEMAIFAIDEHEYCQAWADVAKCRQSEYIMVIQCTEYGMCERISCRRSCDIVLIPDNEVPCKRLQRRDWYDDLREEYLDHSTISNRLRNEALFKMFFFGKVHDIIAEYVDQDMVYSVLDLLNNNERSSLIREAEEQQGVLFAISKDHVNVYNLMTYYLNIATGRKDYAYVSSPINQTFYEKLPDYIISDAMDQLYKYDDEVDVDWWYSTWPSHPEERKVSTSKIISKASFELDLRDEVLMNKTNVIDYVLSGMDSDDRSFIQSLLEGGLEKEAVRKKGVPNLNLDGKQHSLIAQPSDAEAGSSKITPLKAGTEDSASPLENEYLFEPPCTRAIKQWLEDRREFFNSWRDEMDYKYRVEKSLELNILPQEPFLFQGYLVGKMIDLVVPEVYGEKEGTHTFSFETLSFSKIADTEKRDRVSAYLLSLLSDEERTKLLYRLDELEGKLLRNTHSDIEQLGFDFNNLMEYFLNYYHENVTRRKARQILDFYQKVLVAAYDEDGKLGSGMRRMYLDMFTQLDDDDERSLIENGTTKVKEILLPLGEDKEYHNWYNVMTYFENIAKGTELEYVTTSVLLHNLDMLERFLPDDYDVDKASNSTDYEDTGVKSSIMTKIESVLTSKPHPDLDDSWKWTDLSDTMLFDVCDRIGYGNDLVSMLYKTHLHGMMIRVAKECHIVQALRGVLPEHYEDWVFLRRRDAIEYMVTKVSITYDERSDLRRTYIDAIYPNIEKEKLKQTVVKETTYFERLFEGMLYIIGLLITLSIVKLCQIVLPKKKKSRKKPKNAKKKDKTSIYSHLISFAHHVHTMLLGTSSKLCRVIWKTPSLLLAVVLTAFDSVTDAFRSTANASFGIIKHLFTSICSILSRGMKCLVLIPQMISTGIGVLIRLPSKLIRETVGTEHASIDQPSNSSPQRSEAPQLVMSPSSAVSTVAVDEKKVNTIRKLEAVYDDSDNNLAEESPLDTAPREEGVPSEIGIVNSSLGMTRETITEVSISSFNDKSKTSKALSTFELNENDPLLIFLRSQEACIKGSVDEFYTWLVKYENIESMIALKEAVSDDDYLNDTMRIGDRSYGVKGFKLKSFRCAILEHEDTKPVQQESKNITMNPPEELVCPISLVLMTNDPVVAADGITYERASIEDWFKKSMAKISEAQENLKQNPHSESDQRVVENGVCSPVHGTKIENLVLVPNISLRNMARAYKEEKRRRKYSR